jgi:hypothetical protein
VPRGEGKGLEGSAEAATGWLWWKKGKRRRGGSGEEEVVRRKKKKASSHANNPFLEPNIYISS